MKNSAHYPVIRPLTTGKMFVLEGADDVGKTTLAKALAAKLRERGLDCLYASFPGREENTLGHHIYQLHHYMESGEIYRANPTALQMLHIAAHIDAIENRILPALNAGRYVILDRFWWSTMVYGRASSSKLESLELMIQLEQAHWQGVKPEAVFHIECSTPFGGQKTEEQMKIWRRWKSGYKIIAQQEREHYPVIDVVNEGPLADALHAMLKIIPVDSPV